MKIITFLLLSVLLCACSTTQPVPVKQTWPDVSKDLLQPCPDLKLIQIETPKLSDILDNVTDNYSIYYDCKSKIDDWIIWYNGQKEIFNRK
jgi:hypothetical protein